MIWTKLCFGPIQKCSEAFLGLLVKTKVKAYTKLTIVMCCQIVARKSVAPSSGDFCRRLAPWYACGQDQRFWRKKNVRKIIITPLPRLRADFQKCVTSMNFQELLVFFCLAAWLWFFSFKQILFIKTSWWLVHNRKKLRLVLRYYWEFFYKYKINFEGMLN